MKINVTWCLESVGERKLESMVGTDTVKIPRGKLGYAAEFSLDQPQSDCEWLLLDLGDNGHAQTSKVFLNNTELGVVHGPWTALRYCIPRKLLQKHNQLFLERTGNVWGYWLDNGPRTTCERDHDLTPDSALALTEFHPLRKVVQTKTTVQGAVAATACGRQIGLRFPEQGGLRLNLTADTANPEERTIAESVALVDDIGYTPAKSDFQSGTAVVTGKGLTARLMSDPQTGLRIKVEGGTGTSSPAFRILLAGSTAMLQWELTTTEEIYGLGENTEHGMNKRGHQESIWVIHSFSQCDKPIPFMLSTAGYGLHLISSERAVFDLGAQAPDTAWCWLDGEELDFMVFPENDFRRMIRLYTDLTGKSPLPPRWAFGYWQSTTRAIGQDELENNIRGFVEQDFPIDVIAIDPNWQKPGFQSWLWDSDPGGHFPEPQRFLDLLHKHGLRLALWTCPFINQTSPLYEEAVESGYVFTDSRASSKAVGKVDWWMGTDAALVDFTNPEAVAWWKERLEPLIKSGVSVLKIDGGDTHEAPVNLQSASGISMRELHNLYPVLFARAVYTAMEELAGDERLLVWIRTGWSGIQRFPCTWGGDQLANFEGGRVLIRAGQQAGLAGIPFWTHDLGGFAGQPTEEYYIRSFQWGVLNPLARGHGMAAAPWEVSERANRIIKQWMNFRYSLLPTLYSYAWHSHATGEPMMRAMVLDCQNDEEARRAQFQYRLGPDILVAPVFEEGGKDDLSAEREVYLPSGLWYDLHRREWLEGGCSVRRHVPIEETPVYIRAGAILVRESQALRASSLPEELTVEVYPGGAGRLLFYEDDGHSQAYREGSRTTAEISTVDHDGRMTIELKAREGAFPEMIANRKVWLSLPGLPVQKIIDVHINGRRETSARTGDAELLTIDVSDWWNTPRDTEVTVKYA